MTTKDYCGKEVYTAYLGQTHNYIDWVYSILQTPCNARCTVYREIFALIKFSHLQAIAKIKLPHEYLR